MPPRNLLETAQRIVIEGPIGAGKTSLARRLAAHLDAQPFLERSEQNPFLVRFHQDQARYALPTQLFFLFQRIDQLRLLAEPEMRERRVVSDYLLEKDPLFAQLTLGDEELALYRQVYDRLSPTAPTPDLVIYLEAKPETLMARVKKRGAEGEHRIPDSWLARLAERYAAFFYHYEAAPVMVVNSENLNFVDRDDDFRLLLERIETMRGQRGYFNRGE